MKTRTKWIVIVMVVLFLAITGTYLQMQQKEETVKIGGLFGLTGFSAEWGNLT